MTSSLITLGSILSLLVLVPEVAQLAVIVQPSPLQHQPTPSDILLRNPTTSIMAGLTSLCSEPISSAKHIDWEKMLGTWYLEAATTPDSSGNRCVAQTFDEVDTEYGVVEKTMFVVPAADDGFTTDNNVNMQATPMLLKTVGVFDPNEPNTIISIFGGQDGEKVPVETIILDTDYTTYALGYECSGRSGDGMAFEHMAVLTRSGSPLSDRERWRLTRRALWLIPHAQRAMHKFYRSSKDGCSEFLVSRTARASGGADSARVLNPQDTYIDPRVFNRAN